MFQHSDLVVNSKPIVTNKLMSYAKVLYGVTPENLPVELFQLVLKFLTENLSEITVNDIDLAFQNATIEKREYVSLTRDELLLPIKTYWAKKKIIEMEYNKLIDEKKKESEINIQDKIFLMKAKELYIQSLNEGKMLLDEFYSNALSKYFIKCISETEMNNIDIESNREYKERKFIAEEKSVFALVPSVERIKSRMIIEKCLEKKINITTK